MPKISYEKLIAVVRKLGFVSRATRGTHRVFVHKPTGALLLLPASPPRTNVPAASLAAVRMSIIGQNAATQDQVDGLLGIKHLQRAG